MKTYKVKFFINEFYIKSDSDNLYNLIIELYKFIEIIYGENYLGLHLDINDEIIMDLNKCIIGIINNTVTVYSSEYKKNVDSLSEFILESGV